MRVQEIKETKVVVVRTEYIANDGKVFTSIEECQKYECTCKAVLRADYQRLVIGNVCEYDLFCENGSEEYSYDIIKISSKEDMEIANRVFVYGKARPESCPLIEREGEYLVLKDYENEISGYWCTLEDKINEMRQAYNHAKEEKGKN